MNYQIYSGMDGYVLICRNCDKNDGNGECGILMTPSFPVANVEYKWGVCLFVTLVIYEIDRKFTTNIK